MMSHLGKIKTEEDKAKNSLKIVSDRLSELLEMEVNFIAETRSDQLSESLNNNRLTLMENTRYEDYPNKLESKCDEELSKYWASIGEVFINDAFGTSHRQHASNYGISKYLPSGYGFLINEELTGLAPIVSNVEKPFVVIMGGAKVDDKIRLIESMLEECDYLLVGGGIANTFLKANGYNIGLSLHSQDYVSEVSELINKYKDKIWMPVDVVAKEEYSNNIVNIEDIKTDSIIYDIGPKTIEIYREILLKAKTVFVNGTMGLYEEEPYRNGTESLFKVLEQCDSTNVAGGGDAVASVKKLNYETAFDFLSTGGGASLEYIADKSLKCFEE
jgi:phosphoglycerate kinase